MTTHWIVGIGRPKLATMSGKAMLTAESSGTVIVPRPISATCAVRFPGTSGCPVRSESDLAFDHHLDQHRLRARHRLAEARLELLHRLNPMPLQAEAPGQPRGVDRRVLDALHKEERRVGKRGDSTCGYRWGPDK